MSAVCLCVDALAHVCAGRRGLQSLDNVGKNSVSRLSQVGVGL